MRDCTRIIIIMAERIIMSDKILVIVSKRIMSERHFYLENVVANRWWQKTVRSKTISLSIEEPYQSYSTPYMLWRIVNTLFDTFLCNKELLFFDNQNGKFTATSLDNRNIFLPTGEASLWYSARHSWRATLHSSLVIITYIWQRWFCWRCHDVDNEVDYDGVDDHDARYALLFSMHFKNLLLRFYKK